MAAKYENLTPLSTAVFDINSTGVKATVAVPFKCRVYRAQVTMTTADAGGFTIRFNKVIKLGGATGAGDVAEIVVPAASAIGKCYYDLVARGMILYEGDTVVLNVTAEGAGASTFAYGQLIVDYIPEVEANSTGMVETA